MWETKSGKLLYKLPGHKGTVNDARFAPGDEPISKCLCTDDCDPVLICSVVSGSSDRTLMLGELGK